MGAGYCSLAGRHPHLAKEVARRLLVEEYLRCFGPATETDVAWWTGWPLGVTRKAVAATATVDLGDGLLALADDTDLVDMSEQAEASAALLPALDPTPMGWKERDWYLPEDWAPLYARMGNLGPTVWWRGEVIGAWAAREGAVVTRLLVDRGAEAVRAVDATAERLGVRLDGATIKPSFPTPLSRELGAG